MKSNCVLAHCPPSTQVTLTASPLLSPSKLFMFAHHTLRGHAQHKPEPFPLLLSCCGSGKDPDIPCGPGRLLSSNRPDSTWRGRITPESWFDPRERVSRRSIKGEAAAGCHSCGKGRVKGEDGARLEPRTKPPAAGQHGACQRVE